MKKTAAIILCLVVTLSAGFLYAADTSFRCGDDLISIGYTTYQIRNSCGAPDSEQIIGQQGQKGTDTAINITQWTYNRDSGVYILTFLGSKLIKMEFQRL